MKVDHFNLLYLIFMLSFLSCQKADDGGEKPGLSDVGLIAYFPLDSGFVDAGGNNNPLEGYGAPEFVEGYTNETSTALLLNGEEDYLVGSIGHLDTFSISMWLESYRYFVGEWPKRRSTIFDFSNKQVYGDIDGSSGATQINCGIESEHVAGVDIGNGSEWFHLYIAVSNGVKIYLNGILQTTELLQNTVTYLSDTIYFGRASNDEEIDLTYFYGKIDEIRIYNRVLDQAEIEELSIK
jgi:hypothetical protein